MEFGPYRALDIARPLRVERQGGEAPIVGRGDREALAPGGQANWLTVVVQAAGELVDYTIVAIEDRAICSVVDLTGSRTPDRMRWLEKMLGNEITTRTWTTIHRILRKKPSR